MQLVREKEFVNQYHYDARNLEWEKKTEHQRPILK
ncbi:transposase [Streptococcus pyogenes]|nr:transposase [Streptococcus pyogenes]